MEILTGTVREVLEKVDLGKLDRPSTSSIRVPVGRHVYYVDHVRPGADPDVSIVIVNPDPTE